MRSRASLDARIQKLEAREPLGNRSGSEAVSLSCLAFSHINRELSLVFSLFL
jgi:hypothetical protein